MEQNETSLQETSSNTPTGWISVNDRLPETYVDVLGWRPISKKITICWVDAFNVWMHDFGTVERTLLITHWMPLPTPPQN